MFSNLLFLLEILNSLHLWHNTKTKNENIELTRFRVYLLMVKRRASENNSDFSLMFPHGDWIILGSNSAENISQFIP